MAAKQRPLKVLAIHGYRQNADTFRLKTGAFRKAVKKQAEFYYMSAPNIIPAGSGPSEENEVTSSPDSEDHRGWWFSGENSSYNPHQYSDLSTGYEASLEAVKLAFIEQGPFDGILGFSQGAAFVSLLCGLQQQQKLESPIGFRFVILVAGFKSRSSQHAQLYDAAIEVPSLHVYGETDKVIPGEMSSELVKHFVNPVCLTHSGGHFVPAASQDKSTYTSFLENMCSICLQ